MKSKEKGDLAVSQAIAYYSISGNQVLLPLGDRQKYDLVIHVENTFKKVQCKYTSYRNKNGKYVVELRTQGGNKSSYNSKCYADGDFDLLFAMTATGDLYELPYNEVKNRKTLILCDKRNNFKVLK